MKISTFKGGIIPPHIKDTATSEIKYILPQKGAEMIYPMRQHMGAPCEPTVEKGEMVTVGQKVGDSPALLSSPVHATVSGVVTDIRSVLSPTGITTVGVCIENDDLYTEHPLLNIPSDYQHMTREALLTLIRESGIIGLGGAGFPTHVKLNPPPEKKIDHIFVNAAECEPYLTTDHRVLLEETEKIFLGLHVILTLFPQAKGVIAVETNKADALAKLTAFRDDKANRTLTERISIAALKPKYPQGSEKQLIYACTGREVPSGGLPADVGCIVQNVDTVIAIHRAVFRGRPLMRKIVTIAGGAVKNPGNYKIRLGMRYQDVMDAIGGFTVTPCKMISGGPMMGVAMFSLEVPVIKTSAAFLAFTDQEAARPPERNCIHCGRCVSVCPAGLIPIELNQYAIRAQHRQFAAYRGLDCIECGSCSYICPSKRYLAQSIRAVRRELMAAGKK